MRLLCRWNQNRLAREICANPSAAPSAVLLRHLVRCSECRHAYDEMVQLSEELAQGFAMPMASEHFAQGVFNKIKAHSVLPRQHAFSGKWLAVGGCTAIVICGVFLWQSRQNSIVEPPPLTANLPSKHSNSPLSKTEKRIPPQVATERLPTVSRLNPKPRSVARTARKKRKVYLASHTAHKPYRRYRSVYWQPQVVQQTIVLTPEMRSERWTQWASYYENQGEYSHAADAYAQAYDAVPTEGTAFSAGQAAENAGDVSQAILYYSQILRQPLKQKPQTEKGTRLWNSERDAA